MNRLFLAFAAFVVLGVLAYVTLPDPRIRLMTFAILSLFAVRTWLRRGELLQKRREDDGHE
jgi:membrane protein implicated in regulation of membrane protease activity